jgi:hypothetical protein
VNAASARIPIFLLLLSLCVFYLLAMERTRAFLAAQSLEADAKLAQGSHPWSLDFDANAWIDARQHLIGERAFSGRLWKENNKFLVSSDNDAFELRLNLRGGLLFPEDVRGFELAFGEQVLAGKPLQVQLAYESPMVDPALAKISICLIVRPQMSDLILTSTRCFPANQVQDLFAMTFASAADSVAPKAWLDLGPLTFFSVYVNDGGIDPLHLSHLRFSLARELERLEVATVLPEQILLDAQRAQAKAGFWPNLKANAWWPSLETIATINVMLLTIFLVPYALSFAFEQPALVARSRLQSLMFLCVMTAMLVLFVRDAAQLLDWRSKPGVFALGSVVAALVLICISFWRSFSWRGAYVAINRGWLPALLFTSAMAAVLWIGFAVHSAIQMKSVGNYLLFALIQQFLLTRLLVSLRRSGLSKVVSVWLSASIFALLHAPNFALMCLCFLAGLYWCAHYLRFRNIWPLVLSHALLGWLAVTMIPPEILRNAKIGFGFFIN